MLRLFASSIEIREENQKTESGGYILIVKLPYFQLKIGTEVDKQYKLDKFIYSESTFTTNAKQTAIKII